MLRRVSLATAFIPSAQDSEGFLSFAVRGRAPVGNGGGCCGQRCDAFDDDDVFIKHAGGPAYPMGMLCGYKTNHLLPLPAEVSRVSIYYCTIKCRLFGGIRCDAFSGLDLEVSCFYRT